MHLTHLYDSECDRNIGLTKSTLTSLLLSLTSVHLLVSLLFFLLYHRNTPQTKRFYYHKCPSITNSQLNTISDILTLHSVPLSLSSPLFIAHGIRADGDAKEADVGAAGVGSGGNCTGPAGPARPGQPTGLKCVLLLLVLLL